VLGHIDGILVVEFDADTLLVAYFSEYGVCLFNGSTRCPVYLMLFTF
jgi:hypothetical protein